MGAEMRGVTLIEKEERLPPTIGCSADVLAGASSAVAF